MENLWQEDGIRIAFGIAIAFLLFLIKKKRMNLNRPKQDHVSEAKFYQRLSLQSSKRPAKSVNSLNSQQQEEINRVILKNPIQAIQLFREYTGVGLKEGKDAIESHLDDLKNSGRF
jgi:hypothetical protein